MKITMKTSKTMKEFFDDFIIAKKAQGLADKTIKSYQSQFRAINNHLDVNVPIEDITKSDLEKMVTSMRNSNLAANSISTYVRILRVFLSWCNEEGITNLNMKPYKSEETIKETYSDGELKKLLKKPDLRKCNFAEYRSWVIVNLLLNNGCRAAIIREYMRVRGGEDCDYLFPNESGEQLKEYALRSSIARYNNRRGVQKTSIHSFRHTFARKYLVDCGGNAFTLQRLLGHSTLDMTKHYCAIFDADIVKNYDSFSPLAQLKSNSNKIKMDRNRTK